MAVGEAVVRGHGARDVARVCGVTAHRRLRMDGTPHHAQGSMLSRSTASKHLSSQRPSLRPHPHLFSNLTSLWTRENIGTTQHHDTDEIQFFVRSVPR